VRVDDVHIVAFDLDTVQSRKDHVPLELPRRIEIDLGPNLVGTRTPAVAWVDDDG
jgi:hypothetical protein